MSQEKREILFKLRLLEREYPELKLNYNPEDSRENLELEFHSARIAARQIETKQTLKNILISGAMIPESICEKTVPEVNITGAGNYMDRILYPQPTERDGYVLSSHNKHERTLEQMSDTTDSREIIGKELFVTLADLIRLHGKNEKDKEEMEEIKKQLKDLLEE